MKTLYLECGMGAAGDMLMAALWELLPDREAFPERMNRLGLPGVRIVPEPAVKAGITGTHMRVLIDGEEETASEDHDHHDHHDHDHHDHDHHDHDHHDHDHHDHDHHDHDHHDHDHHDHDHHDHDHHDHDHHDHDHHDHDHHDHDHGGHSHHHASVRDINTLIDGLDVSEKVKADAKAVYALIAEAESRVHGRPVDRIHFHEVGTLDAVADVVGVCLLMEMLAPEQVLASPVHVGAGHVRCAHGVLPVPAPATALILTGVPTYGGEVRGELCTPTGAALLKHFVRRFGDRPVMAADAVGYGMGQKDFERANCVRAFLGESAGGLEPVARLECNLDDMTGEDIGYAMERLFEAGARDVYTVPCGMKKNRPGVLLTCICLAEDADRLAGVMMRHTTTLGIRRVDCGRYVLDRRTGTADTPLGPVRTKTAQGMGTAKSKPEFDDLARIARERGLSLAEVRRELNR